MLKTIGVLGGMGPEAGAHFFERLVHETGARRDQDHPPVVLYSLPQVPDRTAALVGGGPSPAAAILRGLRVLREAGADFAVIACVSAHAFLPRLGRRAPLPLISLIDETVAAVKRMRPVPERVGLLATTGTIRAGILAGAFRDAGIQVLAPSARDQAKVMTAIYGRRGIKVGFVEGRPREAVLETAAGLIRRGARALVAGCTEIPLVLEPSDLPVPLVDPLVFGARAAIRLSGARLRRP